MRDPLDRKRGAFESLGVDRQATLAAINVAYARLANASPIGRQALSEAFHRLRRPESRLEEEFWYYPVHEDRGEPVSDPGATPVACSWTPAPPVVDLRGFAADVETLRHAVAGQEVRAREMAVSRSSRYTRDPLAAVPFNFDR